MRERERERERWLQGDEKSKQIVGPFERIICLFVA